MKIAITGATGQLGSALVDYFGRRAIPLTRRDFDLVDPTGMATQLIQLAPDVLINAAAYTAVDQAETEPRRCLQVNAFAVDLIADVCDEIDCTLVQISTDYVFHGPLEQPYDFLEFDAPNPQSIYAKSKLSGECFAARCAKHFVVRTCGLYAPPQSDKLRPGRNFPETMLMLAREGRELNVVDDQICTPTAVPDLVRAIAYLLDTEAFGTYHLTNSGRTHWLDFARRLFELSGVEVKLHAISSAQYGAAAARPPFSVLNTDKYHELGGPEMPSWDHALEQYVRSIDAVTRH